MAIKKDILTDIIYSIFIVLVLFIEGDFKSTEQLIIVEIFKSLIISSLMFIHVMTLTARFSKSLYYIKPNSRVTIFSQIITLLKHNKVKIIVLILVYSISLLISKIYNFEIILHKSIQVFLTSLVVLTFYNIIFLFNKRNVHSLFAILLFVTHSIFFTVFSFYENKIILLFLPSNYYLWVVYKTTSYGLLTLLFSSSIFYSLYFISARKIFNGFRVVNLPSSRIN